jgi:drug/metabolite transporter (DMT)-like permease
MLGAILAVFSAATFALNNAAARRGVVTGTPIQGMAVTIPLGVVCFLPFALISGGIAGLPRFSAGAIAWLAAVGLLHFLGGRYCNYRASQLAGVNLTAPVIQLQVVVTLTLAVIVLGEPCTLLQLAGGVVMVLGSLVTQGRPAGRKRPSARFNPRQGAGFLFASLAALVYGTTPIMVRTALDGAGPWSGMMGGLIAYGAATIAVALALASGTLRRNVMALRRENLPMVRDVGRFRRRGPGLPLLRARRRAGPAGCTGHAVGAGVPAHLRPPAYARA